MQASNFNPYIIILSISILLIVSIMLMALVFFLMDVIRKNDVKIRAQNSSRKQHRIQKNSLTNLENRFGLIEKTETLIAKKNRANIALLFLDIDDFNNINTVVGVETGDLLLKNTADIIKKYISVYSNDIYHIGSDEFAIILYDVGDNSKILRDIITGLIDAVAKPMYISDYNLQISCCVGVCLYPECADNSWELLRNAGCARTDAKSKGYGSYSIYSKEMSKMATLRSIISSDLKYALSRKQFTMAYQPIINISTGKVHAVEALLRWNHPSMGNITPDVFIPVMEDLGIIHPVGKWIANTTFKDICRVHKKGFTDINLSINISPQQFDKGDIATLISEAIWETNVDPSKVFIELTEELMMKNTDKTQLMLKVLHSMGIKIVIDDFGTGYSSLNHLTRFPVSIIKIDMSFIQGIDKDTVKNIIVGTIISMAKQLSYKVVAEGVETEQELECLRLHGCDYVQGYYYSKPLTFAAFMEFLEKQNGFVDNSEVEVSDSAS